MTISDINTYVSFRADTNTTDYSAANRLISTNRWYHKIVTMILSSQDEWEFDDLNKTDFPIATANLVSGQQDYALPTGILKVKRVEAKLDGGTWTLLSPIDLGQITDATDTTSIANNFTTSAPYYDVEHNSILLYPIPASNVTNGLKVWFQREPSAFTSGEVATGTKEPGFDEAFHIMLGLGMVYDWASAKRLDPLKRDVQEELAEYEQRLKDYYGSKQKDRSYALGSAYPTNYGK
jgi:hypothetical protein